MTESTEFTNGATESTEDERRETGYSQACEDRERITKFDGPACAAGRLTPTDRIAIMNGMEVQSRS